MDSSFLLKFFFLHIVLLFGCFGDNRLYASEPQLTLDYYASTCPTLFDIVRKEMECSVLSDPRNAASIVRLHFHDCFIQGCDGSILLDDTYTLKGEKKAATNIHSLKGFEVIDKIKNFVESECRGIVSCADILTIAARDAVILVGGPYWDVPVGRKDSVTASFELANTNLPTPDESLVSIIPKFFYQGLSVTDMVALVGSHTIGMAKCQNFRSRIYGDYESTSVKNPISDNQLNNLKSICPPIGGGDNNITAMDYVTPNLFDNSFYQLLLKGEGVLNSDQEMYSSVFGIQTRELVKKYAADSLAFFQQFSDSMVKMGNITNSESFVTGEVRKNCIKTSENQQKQPKRCKAAVCRKPGEPLIIEEIFVAPPMPREARIRIICTSLCHSDIIFWNMQGPPAIVPRILGHEAIGVVESVGEDVTELTKGDTVIPIFMADCEECIDCKSTKSNLCSKFPFEISPSMIRYDTSRFTDLNGEIIHHFLFVSSFSEYTVVDIANLLKIDPAVPPNRACLLSCGVSTGVGAAWKTANVEPGSTVAIFGLGCIGLAVAEGARLCGATRIIGVDIKPEKFEIGKKFGITDFVHAGECENKSVSQVIIEMTGGGADYCFECVGMASLVHEAYAACRKGWGKTIMLGVDKPGSKISINSNDVLFQGKTLMGSIFGGLKPKTDVPILFKRYMDKELNLDEFVTHEVKFKDINKAFDLLVKGECLRCVIWMDK